MRGREQLDESTDRWSRHDWWGVVLDSPDPRRLAHYYSDLLGWEISNEDDDGAGLSPRDSVAYLAVQRNPEYVRPAWPTIKGSQQMMLHLDFEVSDLEEAVGHAVELGGVLAAYQPQDDVRVILDPDGHPFCLYVGA